MPPVAIDSVMAEQRAAEFAKRSIKKDAKRQGLTLALSMLDLTTLEGADSEGRVRELCRKAITPDTTQPDLPSCAAVCVYPTLVATARRELDRAGDRGRAIHVASVATGFPSGQYPLEVRLDDTRRAVEAGATEIDMVISRGKFLAGRRNEVFDEICAVKETCTTSQTPDGRTAHLKVILETGELHTLDNVRAASDLAIAAGADFIKTSTGKVAPAATMPVTYVMLNAVRDHFDKTGERIGVKPAGGIRTAKQALAYLVMVNETVGPEWLTPTLFRFGASSLANDLLRQLAKLRTGAYAAADDFSR